MLFAAYWWIPRTMNEEPRPKQNLVNQPKLEAPEKKPPVESKKTETKNAFAALTERFADTTRDHAKVVGAAVNLDAIEKLRPMDEIPMVEPGMRGASQEFSDGVRTVTHNARKAFDFFARELPMPDIGEAKN
jgi:hypothetical protein